MSPGADQKGASIASDNTGRVGSIKSILDTSLLQNKAIVEQVAALVSQATADAGNTSALHLHLRGLPAQVKTLGGNLRKAAAETK